MNQQEYELIAKVFQDSRQRYGGRTDSVLIEIIEDMANELATTYKNFDRAKFMGLAVHGEDEDGYPLCPVYGAKVLPNEEGQCSLCDTHKAW